MANPARVRLREDDALIDLVARMHCAERYHADALRPERVHPEIEEAEIARVGDDRAHVAGKARLDPRVGVLDLMKVAICNPFSAHVETGVQEQDRHAAGHERLTRRANRYVL